ncbi:LuxR C-terminal-related transcriptional regulator [Agromyces sp. Soil535]|uniref:LuxR C-terminal-related transcriptional regulator n=1 Tax=Agromyces sp. Soil535 TaxID=1736390 RepID=UPI0012E3D9D1|nr:LuxR C-terminal-related transcriptional regulator [Agromyces sp. Soil535]
MTYLVTALRGAVSGEGVDPLATQVTEPLSVEASLTALLNEAAQASHRVVLVLDDFQSMEVAPTALTFLLDHLPSALHMVIASRSDPPLPLARMRGRGELTELRGADLRFTPEEAAAFLNQVMALGLAAEDIAALETRTEGWIAGLQLAALSMRDRSDIPGFIKAFTGSHRFVIDYLGEEVLQRQPDHVRDFLVSTAFLDRLSAPLCEAVTGRTDSSELLEILERDNLFVVPLDDRREWYRYHHLFADVLRARSLRDGPDRVRALHRLASDWYERNDLPEDAVRHALAAADFERAAGLVERAMPEIRRRRQDATLLGWLKLLPDEVASRRPVLSVYYAWSMLISGELDEVERRLDDAERALGGSAHAHASADGEELRMLPVMIPVYRASLAQARGDVAGTLEHARRALDRAQPGDHLGRGAAAGFLGMALWASGDLEPAVRTFADARTSLGLAGNTADVLGSTLVLADMFVVQGRRREARRAYEHSLQLATAQGELVPQSTADLHAGVSELDREQDELEAATEHLRASKALGGRASLPENRYRWFVAMSRIREAEGEPDAALDLLDEAERLYLRGFLPETRPIAAMKARIWIAQGKLAEARAWADGQGLSAADDLSYLREFDHITVARLLIAEHRADRQDGVIREALDLLERLLGAAEAASRTGSANEILVLQALGHQAKGHTALALVPLNRALVQCQPEGYIRLFADEGTPMAALLKEAEQQGIAPGYVRRLLGAFGPAEGKSPLTPTEMEALSEREVHVLKLLSTELSGPEIARELFVSLNTVRTHTSHIFRKLAVNSRPAAVRRARELGLL